MSAPRANAVMARSINQINANYPMPYGFGQFDDEQPTPKPKTPPTMQNSTPDINPPEILRPRHVPISQIPRKTSGAGKSKYGEILEAVEDMKPGHAVEVLVLHKTQTYVQQLIKKRFKGMKTTGRKKDGIYTAVYIWRDEK